MTVARAALALQCLREALRRRRAIGQEIEPAHGATPTERHEPYAFSLTRRPAVGVSGRDVEAHAPRPGAIEEHAAVHLEEREVRADEDHVIGGVLDVQLDRR